MGSFDLGMQTQPTQQQPTMQMPFEWHNLVLNNSFLLMKIDRQGSKLPGDVVLPQCLEIFKLEKALNILV